MKQIFILEKHELDELRNGEPLKILLGDQTITLHRTAAEKGVPDDQAGNSESDERKQGPDQMLVLQHEPGEH